MTTEIVPKGGRRMLTPTPSSLADYIKSSDLTLEEAEAIQSADAAIRDNMAGCALAFIELAAKVRPEVLYQFGAMYGLSREALEATVRQGAAGIKRLQQEAKQLIANTVVAMRQEGKTQQQIADATGISDREIRRVDAEQVEEVRQRHANGESQGSIAKSMGLSRPRVNQIISGKSGHESKRTNKVIPDSVKAQIVEMVCAGTPIKEIAQHFSVSRNTVERIRVAAGSQPSAPAALPDTPSTGRTVEHSDRYHSPSLARLRDPSTPEAIAMESYRQQFMTAVQKSIADIEACENRLLRLQNRIQEDYTLYHGSMIARWAAYERIWADEMIERVGADTFAGVPVVIQGRLKSAIRRSNEFLATLDRFKNVPYTIED